MKKRDIKDILTMAFIFACLWICFTSLAYGIKHPEKTDTERFLHIPKSAMLNFNE